MTSKKSQKIVWTPQKKQIEALKRTEFEVLYGGARGGGKTDAGLAWMLYNIDNPLYRGLVIRKQADDLSDWIDRAGIMYSHMNVNIAYRPAVLRFPNGAVIRTGHLKDANAYTKYMGHEYPRILIEELTHIPDEESYLKLIASCRSTVDGLTPQIFATTNPGNVGHSWVQKRWRCGTEQDGKPFVDEETGRTRIFIPAKVEDNPILMKADPMYVKFLDGLPENLKLAWKDGRWDIFEGQFFEMWDKKIHVIDDFDLNSAKRIYMCGDYGYRAPSAVYWIAETDSGCVVYKELYEKELDYYQLQQRMRAMTSNDEMAMLEYCVFDTSIWARSGSGKDGGSVLSEVFPMKKASKEREIGWSKLKQMLKKQNNTDPPMLRFTTDCRQAIRTFPTRVYNDKAVGRYDDMDSSGEDHCQDSLRYFSMEYLGREDQYQITSSETYEYDDGVKRRKWKSHEDMLDYDNGYN